MPAEPHPPGSGGRAQRLLAAIERWGNRLPDPALLFFFLLLLVWAASALLAPIAWSEIDPRSGAPLRVQSQLSGGALVGFLTGLVTTFTGFHPLGVVLVAMLGVGVAEQTGFISAAIRALLARTSARWLTPLVLLGAIASHSAADAGFVLVIPMAALIYRAAGRHPLAGIAAGFCGVSGGFGASFIPAALDPLLAGLTQAAAQIVEPGRTVNPLSNWFFGMASCGLIVAVGWYLTDRVIEPRLAAQAIDGDGHGDGDGDGAQPATGRPAAALGALSSLERRGLWLASAALLAGLALLAAAAAPAGSPLRAADGSLSAAGAPLMQAIVPLIFLLFVLPGVVYGYAARTVNSHRDVVRGMASAMSTMGYYLVLAFFAAQFIAAFGKSNLGALLALKGAAGLQALALPAQVTIVGVILLSLGLDLFIGSASAKWAFLAPILVPMLMTLGLSPELTQAAYRIGDSAANIVTPLMPYFPLVVVYARRWVKQTGVGTMVALMLPYSLVLLVTWTALLLVYWALGLPLGLEATYRHPR